MTDIFLSYATVDLERSHPLADALEARGWSVWWDRKIPPGKSYEHGVSLKLELGRQIGGWALRSKRGV